MEKEELKIGDYELVIKYNATTKRLEINNGVATCSYTIDPNKLIKDTTEAVKDFIETYIE